MEVGTGNSVGPSEGITRSRTQVRAGLPFFFFISERQWTSLLNIMLLYINIITVFKKKIILCRQNFVKKFNKNNNR